jgi:hypothetical protein
MQQGCHNIVRTKSKRNKQASFIYQFQPPTLKRYAKLHYDGARTRNCHPVLASGSKSCHPSARHLTANPIAALATPAERALNISLLDYALNALSLCCNLSSSSAVGPSTSLTGSTLEGSLLFNS